MNQTSPKRPATLQWVGSIDGHLEVLDQRLLPGRTEYLHIQETESLWQAIKSLAVRGAPAIGVAAAYGMVLAGRSVPATSQSNVLMEALARAATYLKSARPTAVNLAWAVDRMIRIAQSHRGIGVRPLRQRLLLEAAEIQFEDAAMCLAIGRHGASFIKNGMGVLTHCNAGALAASDHGTALAILYEAQRRGIHFRVFIDETRPLLQGARLTAWELLSSDIDATLICDNMAGLVMKQKKVDIVIVGADRIAANGDTANKIGTYSVAQLAKAHNIPFLIAAPTSTFDLSLPSGDHIPIEERSSDEITQTGPPLFPPMQIAPLGIKTYNPAFDVTPADLIAAIVTDKGVISPVHETTIRALLN
ncbi:MAG: S-methyl-5-thioribose-1-phosphate isomerase [Phycisphaerales bacterium]|nr:S-methyl-5-thioribose-1-phosphate isomerase [Phycisphaerales bacterium]